MEKIVPGSSCAKTKEGMRENGELRELLVFDITEWFELIENEKQTMARSCKIMLKMLKGFRLSKGDRKLLRNFK